MKNQPQILTAFWLAVLLASTTHAQVATDPNPTAGAQQPLKVAASEVAANTNDLRQPIQTDAPASTPAPGSRGEYDFILHKVRLLEPDQPHEYTVDGKRWVLYGYSKFSKGAAKRNPNRDLAQGKVVSVELLYDGNAVNQGDVQEAASQAAIVARHAGSIGQSAMHNVFWAGPVVAPFVAPEQLPIYQIIVEADDGTTYAVQTEYRHSSFGSLFQYKPGDRAVVCFYQGMAQLHT